MNKDLNVRTDYLSMLPKQSLLSLDLFQDNHNKECNRTLFESSKIKYLGLILDNRLNWKAHIAELTKKLSRAVGL